MTWLSRRLDNFFDAHGDGITEVVKGLTAAAPKFGVAAELWHEHNKWLRNARLNVEYFGPKAEQHWIWPDAKDEPFLVCSEMWIFSQRSKDRQFLIDTHRSGQHVTSWEAFQKVGGLTDRIPPTPEKPRSFMPKNLTRGNLLDESTWGVRQRVR